jgi:predicted RNA-binding protein with PIN domain
MFIIDGNNLMWSVRQCPDAVGPNKDFQLCRLIGRYLGLIRENGEIIFDGTGPPDKRGFDGIENLEVFFAGAETDTDTVIEEKIQASTAPKRLIIVSSDRRLRKAAHAKKATSIKSEAFWGDIQKQLSRKPGPKEPREKRDGLTEGETEQWLEMFGIEQ